MLGVQTNPLRFSLLIVTRLASTACGQAPAPASTNGFNVYKRTPAGWQVARDIWATDRPKSQLR